MSKFFRTYDSDSSDSSSDEEGLYTSEENGEDIDQERSDEDESDGSDLSDDSGCVIPDRDRHPPISRSYLYHIHGYKADLVSDSESEDEEVVPAAPSPGLPRWWRRSGLKVYNVLGEDAVKNTAGDERAEDGSQEGWTEVVNRRRWNSSQGVDGEKSAST